MEITGTLENWSFDGTRMYGQIRGDVWKRFPDGSQIHTAKLIDNKQILKEGVLVYTNNSTYKLGKQLEIEK